MAKLTYQQRKNLPSSEFVFPKQRKYPVEDLSHARNALARVSQFGSPEEKSKVRGAIASRFPKIRQIDKKVKIKKIPKKKLGY